MFLLEINYKLLWYYVYYAGDGLDYSLVYWSSLGSLSVEGDKNTSAGDRLCGSWPLTLPTAREGVELICQLCPSCDLNTQPWG